MNISGTTTGIGTKTEIIHKQTGSALMTTTYNNSTGNNYEIVISNSDSVDYEGTIVYEWTEYNF